jgi:hypothetical protein
MLGTFRLIFLQLFEHIFALTEELVDRRISMRRLLFACLGLALGFVVPAASPTPAHALTIEINIGTSLNNGRAITCRDGERILRNRGFRDIRRVDCRGRYFVYHARRGAFRFEIAISARNGRVVDFRRLRR